MLRKQNNCFSSPEKIMPPNYLFNIVSDAFNRTMNRKSGFDESANLENFIHELIRWIEDVAFSDITISERQEIYKSLELDKLIFLLQRGIEHITNGVFCSSFKDEMLHRLMRIDERLSSFLSSRKRRLPPKEV